MPISLAFIEAEAQESCFTQGKIAKVIRTLLPSFPDESVRTELLRCAKTMELLNEIEAEVLSNPLNYLSLSVERLRPRFLPIFIDDYSENSAEPVEMGTTFARFCQNLAQKPIACQRQDIVHCLEDLADSCDGMNQRFVNIKDGRSTLTLLKRKLALKAMDVADQISTGIFGKNRHELVRDLGGVFRAMCHNILPAQSTKELKASQQRKQLAELIESDVYAALTTQLGKWLQVAPAHPLAKALKYWSLQGSSAALSEKDEFVEVLGGIAGWESSKVPPEPSSVSARVMLSLWNEQPKASDNFFFKGVRLSVILLAEKLELVDTVKPNEADAPRQVI